jgi:hypothetical protein
MGGAGVRRTMSGPRPLCLGLKVARPERNQYTETACPARKRSWNFDCRTKDHSADASPLSPKHRPPAPVRSRAPGDRPVVPEGKEREYELRKHGDKVGFVDPKTGKFVIDPDFTAARSFVNGVDPAARNRKWGIIDPSGQFVVEPRYEDLEMLAHTGYAVVVLDKKFGVIDMKGNVILEPVYPSRDYTPKFEAAGEFREAWRPSSRTDSGVSSTTRGNS